MLSIETEARLAKLLLSLSEYERNVEISREVLSDNKDFDPYQIFLYSALHSIYLDLFLFHRFLHSQKSFLSPSCQYN